MAFLVASPSSAKERSNPEGVNNGSYPNPWAPRATRPKVPSQVPSKSWVGRPGATDEQAEHLGVVRGVGGIAGDAEFLGGEPGGSHAGRPLEGIDFKPGIVGEHPVPLLESRLRQRKEVTGQGVGFDPGIDGEGGTGFFRIRRSREVAEVGILEQSAEHGPDLLHFVGVAGGDDEMRHGDRRSEIGVRELGSGV